MYHRYGRASPEAFSPLIGRQCWPRVTPGHTRRHGSPWTLKKRSSKLPSRGAGLAGGYASLVTSRAGEHYTSPSSRWQMIEADDTLKPDSAMTRLRCAANGQAEEGWRWQIPPPDSPLAPSWQSVDFKEAGTLN